MLALRQSNRRNCGLCVGLWWPIYVFNLVVNTKLPVIRLVMRKENNILLNSASHLKKISLKRLWLFIVVNNSKMPSFPFVSRSSHVWCRSRRFDCILLVFFRWWGRLVMRDLIKHDALLWLVVFQQLWLVHFDPCCFTQWYAPSAVRCRKALLFLCFLIVGIHASGISFQLSLLMFPPSVPFKEYYGVWPRTLYL